MPIIPMAVLWQDSCRRTAFHRVFVVKRQPPNFSSRELYRSNFGRERRRGLHLIDGVDSTHQSVRHTMTVIATENEQGLFTILAWHTPTQERKELQTKIQCTEKKAGATCGQFYCRISTEVSLNGNGWCIEGIEEMLWKELFFLQFLSKF